MDEKNSKKLIYNYPETSLSIILNPKCPNYFCPFDSNGGLWRPAGSLILPDEPAGTTFRFSQLQISIMNPSGSLKKSCSIDSPFSSSNVLLMYFTPNSFNLSSMASISSHCHTSISRNKNLKCIRTFLCDFLIQKLT